MNKTIPTRLFSHFLFILFVSLSVSNFAQAASVTLAWDAVSPTPDGYKLYQRTGGSSYDYAAPVWTGAGSETNAVLENLDQGTDYYFVVRAFVGQDESVDSNEVTFQAASSSEPAIYTITASAGANGTLSPSGSVSVSASSNQTFSILPAAYHHVRDVVVDGASVGAVASYTFNSVNGDHNITAEFEPDVYTIYATAGINGSISPSGGSFVTFGDSRTYIITAAKYYHISDVLVDGVSVGAVTSYTFDAVNTNHTITARFAADTYTIYATAEANGSISPSGGAFVPYGEDRTYSIDPDAFHHVSEVVVDGVPVGAVTSYTFTAVNDNHTITARFAADVYTIQATAGSNGSISPSGTASVTFGEDRTYTFTADTGYEIADVQVDGISVGVVKSYSFTFVDDNHTISATFTSINHTISASAGAGGDISPSGQVTVVDGNQMTFSVAAQDGYQIEDVLVDNVSKGSISSYTFSNVNADHTIEARFSILNQPPVADAGPNQTVHEETTVTLIGSNSMDQDDGIATFAWRQIAGPSVELEDATAEQTAFMAPAVDQSGISLEFELTVTDYSGISVHDTCIVNVTMVNHPPVADAGDDQITDMGSQVTLDASSSSDADNDAITYHWRQIGEGPVVTLIDTLSVAPSFIAPAVDAGGASIAFELTVTDAGGLQDTDTCMVTIRATNLEPVANAGGDQQVQAGDLVILDGSLSDDTDGTIIGYLWRQTQGTPVQLSDAGAVNPVFTAPEPISDSDILKFELTVTDDQGLQAVGSCIVTVSAVRDTTAPVISILSPNSPSVKSLSSTITITGSASDNVAVAQVYWVDNSGRNGVAQGTTQWSIENLVLIDRKSTLTIFAVDEAGNSASVAMRIFRR